jgi:hypothetical protein
MKESAAPDRHGRTCSDLFRPSTNATLEAMQGGWIYILTNRPNGILYVGVTSHLARRTSEHREGLVEGFTKRYGLRLLVY